MNRMKIAQYIALGATAASILGFCLERMGTVGVGTTLTEIGIMAGLVSYISLPIISVRKAYKESIR